MNRLKCLITFFLLIFMHGITFGVITRSYAYTIRIKNIKLIRVVGPSTINLVINTSIAGSSIMSATFARDSSSYLQMTSIVPENVQRRIIVTAKDGAIPTGMKLELSAGECFTGLGDLGNVKISPVPLEVNIGKDLITGIGSCYTGTSGYRLTYSFGPDPNYVGTIMFNTQNYVSIVYTLTE